MGWIYLLELVGKGVIFLLVRTEGKLCGHGVHVPEREPSVHLPYCVCVSMCVCTNTHMYCLCVFMCVIFIVHV